MINFRPLLYLAVGLVSGILLFETLAGLEGFGKAFVPVAAGLFLLSLSGSIILLLKKRSALFLLLAAFALAFIRMFFASPDGVEAGEYRLTGTVSSVSENGYGTVIVSGAELNGSRLKYHIKLKLSDRSASMPAVGDAITASITLKEPFDGHSYSGHANLAGGYSFSAECVSFETVSSGGMKLKRSVLFIRRSLMNRINELFRDNASVVSGFLLGDRSGIDREDLESFRSTGTAHLLSLSGFHVGVITGIFMALFPKRYRKTRFVFILVFLILYCAVAAFPPSLIRASVMTAAVLLADLFDRKRDPLSSVSLAAIAILAVDPYELWSAGFRLSFAATIGIILFAGIGSVNSVSRAANRIFQLLAVTFSAFLATMLITARCFGYVNTYSIPANLIAVPAFSAAIVMCFIVLLISFPLPAAAGYISWVPDKLIGGIEKSLSFIAGLPYARIEVVRPYAFSGFIMLILLFIISPYVLRPIKKRLAAAVPVLILFTLSIIVSIINI